MISYFKHNKILLKFNFTTFRTIILYLFSCFLQKVSKGNVSGTTSLSNNAIQNSNALSKVNKHNLRDYDNEKDLIRVIRSTNDIVNDVKDLYFKYCKYRELC